MLTPPFMRGLFAKNTDQPIERPSQEMPRFLSIVPVSGTWPSRPLLEGDKWGEYIISRITSRIDDLAERLAPGRGPIAIIGSDEAESAGV